MTPAKNPARDLRRRLEAFHGKTDPRALDVAWPHLGSADRFVRWAARTAIEHVPSAKWAARALAEADPSKRVEALLALARVRGISPPHRKPEDAPVDTETGRQLLRSLAEINWNALDAERQAAMVRAAQVILHRFAPFTAQDTAAIQAKLDPLFPAPTPEMNWLLCETLVCLQSPTVAAKAIALMAAAPTQQEQIEYARSLRMLNTGWTTATRMAQFEWLKKATNFRGGRSFEKFIEFIQTDALATLAPEERVTLAPVLEKKVEKRDVFETLGDVFAGRSSKNWTLEELSAVASRGLTGRNFENGRKMFGAAACFACHRFANEGGMTGPDLTGAGGRYSAHDLLDQILNPSKVINEQFVPSVVTRNNGQTVVGVVVNLAGDTVTLNTNLADPLERVSVNRKEVKSIEPSKVSTMPPMLLAPMTESEVLDLVAYVLSGGKRDHAMFRAAR